MPGRGGPRQTRRPGDQEARRPASWAASHLVVWSPSAQQAQPTGGQLIAWPGRPTADRTARRPGGQAAGLLGDQLDDWPDADRPIGGLGERRTDCQAGRLDGPGDQTTARWLDGWLARQLHSQVGDALGCRPGDQLGGRPCNQLRSWRVDLLRRWVLQAARMLASSRRPPARTRTSLRELRLPHDPSPE